MAVTEAKKGRRAPAAGKGDADAEKTSASMRATASPSAPSASSSTTTAAVGIAVAVLVAAVLYSKLASPASLLASGNNPAVGAQFLIDASSAQASGGQSGIGMRWLLHPLTLEEFFRERWERTPTFIHRKPDYYAPLNSSLAEMERILFIQKSAQRDKLLMHPDSGNSQAGCTWVREGMEDRSREYRDVFEAYLDGCTVVCHIVPAYWPPLATLMRELNRDTNLVYMTNIYLTPRNSQGFTEHTDNKDGFIAQIAGHKHWVMKNSSFLLPLRQQTIGRPHQEPASKVCIRGRVEKEREEGRRL